MPTKKPSLQAVVSNTTYDKIKFLAAQDERSLSQFTGRIIERYLEDYESEHGEIQIPEKE